MIITERNYKINGDLMTPEDKERIRSEIEKRIAETQNSIATLREQTAPVPPSVAIGRLTRMDAIQQKNMAESNLKSAEKLIYSLQVALNKIAEPDFGICTVCKNPIPVERILAVPETKICVRCTPNRKR
jgi:DnaK suppressor protein